MIFHKHRPYQLLTGLCVVAATIATSLPAGAATTTVSQTVTPGLLTLTSPTSATLPPAQTNADIGATSQGSLGTVQVTDGRGTNAGWSLTATTSNFAQIKSPVPSRTGSPTVTSAGAYTGISNGEYDITITTAGGPGTVKFQYSGVETDTLNTVPADGNVVLGTKGVLLNFGAGSYQVGDKYTVEADTMPANNLMVTPAALTTISGFSNGVHLGSAYQFTSTSDSATLMTADSGSGFGAYSTTPTVRLTIPSRSPVGTYTATLTETLN